MRVIALGNCDRSMIKGMTGKPVVFLEGTIEEIRAAAKHLLTGDVEIIERRSPDLASTDGGSNG